MCPSFDARWSAFKPFYTTHREAKIILGQNLPPPSLSPLLSIRWIGRKEGESEYIETPLIERIDKQNTEKKKLTALQVLISVLFFKCSSTLSR